MGTKSYINTNSSMFIEREKYQEIIGLVPILCVDIFAIKDNKVLLWKRTNSPLKWEWCVPGWRLHIGERISDGITRKLKEELWIEYTGEIKNFGTYSTVFDTNSFNEKRLYHTVNIVHIVTLDWGYNLQMDIQNEEFQFFEIREQSYFPDYVNLLIHDYLISHG